MQQAGDVSSWRMHDDAAGSASLFAEYLKLAHAADWGGLMDPEEKLLGKGDCLVVVDVQNDFIPVDEVNPDGGAFGVAEGARCCPLILKLMDQFAAAGGMVMCTRDYHPLGHCSWLENGGPFPRHCQQGSVGSYFYRPIGEKLSEMRKLGRRAEVVFKGYHEDIDSFGSFAYEKSYATGRLTSRDNEDRLYGCSLCDWTGCALLKCSNLDEDVNAPPDVMSIMGRKTLKDVLEKEGIRRVFACGLAMDFCVLDTCINASAAGFPEVFLVMDAARAAHIPGIGQHGTGFLSDLVEIKDKLANAKVGIVPTSALVPLQGGPRSPLAMMQLGKAFPEGLGPWALVPAPELSISLDLQKSTWSATEPKAEIAKLKQFSWEATGSISPVAAITLPGAIRKALNIPMGATKFLWAHPNPNEHTFTDQQFGYMSLTTPSAAFFMFGGFVYLHESNVVQAVMALALGEGLSFEAPAKWRSEYTAALKGRWKAVTAPFLKAKGAKKFAWINPCETLQGSAGDWQVAKHGAFVYSFHEDEAQTDSKDVYFEVAGASSVGRVPTGAIGKYVKSLPKAAWKPGPTGNDSKKPAAEKDKQKDTEKTAGVAGGTRFCCVQ